MAKLTTKKSEKALLDVIVYAIQEKKGEDISILNLKNIESAVTDFFIVVSATSDRQIEAITDSIEEEMINAFGEKPISKEGNAKDGWVLMDYFNIVIHLFLNEKRTIFALEELWGDAEITKID